MVRAPAHFDARERPDTKASPGLPRRAGLLAAFDLARDEVGLRRRRRSTTSLFQTGGSRRSENVRGISESLAFAQNFGFNFQTATQDKHPRSRGAMRPSFYKIHLP